MEFENLPNNNRLKSESDTRPSTEDLSSQDKLVVMFAFCSSIYQTSLYQ